MSSGIRSVDPYAMASTPTGHYMAPSYLRFTEDDRDDLQRTLTRRQSFGNLASLRRHAGEHLDEAQRRPSIPDPSLLFSVVGEYLGNEVPDITRSIAKHAEYTLARTPFNLDHPSIYRSTAHAVRDRLIEAWNDTQQYWTDQDPKRVYYLSLEFLIGRCLLNHLLNLDLQTNFAQATRSLGFQLEEVFDEEKDPALGNGGLGRLAACFLDSLATLNYPAWGYGIRYQYGMFEQRIAEDGSQREFPDFWLTAGNPWEIERLDVTYPVRFYGHVEDSNGRKRWVGGEVVQAVAYDMPIPGYDTINVANLRLWGAKPSKEFDLQAFNEGNYLEAIQARQRAEQISSVLYPNDNSTQGKELRLKQQYFFVCATIRDVLRRFRKIPRQWSELPDKVAIQLNDTHPAIGIAELMRVLVDEEGLPWAQAWPLTQRVFAYTNHTVLPEALEMWSVGLVGHLLPRHLEIIYEINHYHLQDVAATFPGDIDKLQRMSIIEEGHDKKVRMANLAIVGAHAVNGVAAIHSQLIKETIFKDFHDFFPGKFQNKTNGVTPRRWMLGCNPGMSRLITRWIEKSEWVSSLDLLRALEAHANNPQLQHEWAGVKRQNKERLSKYIRETLGVAISPNALFDVQIKRIHEYKRQFLNILYCCRRYMDLKGMTPEQRRDTVPRVAIFGGKAAPGYVRAKLIIRFINQVSRVVNSDPDTSEYFKIVFVPNYNVSNAEIIIPASDLSQHISTAGMEASGTSNMKFAMNGCLIIGTWDGANIEICHEVGEQHMFMFGTKTKEVPQRREEVRNRSFPLPKNLLEVMAAIRNGVFGNPEPFHPLVNSLENGEDYYLLSVDWAPYLEAQRLVDIKYKNQTEWVHSSIMSTAGSGLFSTDRTITEYAEEIWHIKPCKRPMIEKKQFSRINENDDNTNTNTDAKHHTLDSYTLGSNAPENSTNNTNNTENDKPASVTATTTVTESTTHANNAKTDEVNVATSTTTTATDTTASQAEKKKKGKK